MPRAYGRRMHALDIPPAYYAISPGLKQCGQRAAIQKRKVKGKAGNGSSAWRSAYLSALMGKNKDKARHAFHAIESIS